jgi:hypothetical protein
VIEMDALADRSTGRPRSSPASSSRAAPTSRTPSP